MNCGGFSGDSGIIHGMISELICSEDEEVFFNVMDDIFISREVMLFI